MKLKFQGLWSWLDPQSDFAPHCFKSFGLLYEKGRLENNINNVL